MAIDENVANFLRNYRDTVRGYNAMKAAVAANKEKSQKEAEAEITKIMNEPTGTRGSSKQTKSEVKTLDGDISNSINNVLNKFNSLFIDKDEYQKNLDATNKALQDRGIIPGGSDTVTQTGAYEKVGSNVINPADQYTWGSAKTEQPATEENSEDFVEYTYKPGDTFGQVILDLGINTNKGLWGKGGDVEYYTKQLREQGIPGMVPIGRKIRLKKRK